MGKIRVEDLAHKYGDRPSRIWSSSSSRLAWFSTRRIRTIDSEVIEGVLKGKMLHQPREVILRDKESKMTATPARRRPPQRRMPTGLRPPKRRMIQRVEQRIRTIPTDRETQAAPARWLHSLSRWRQLRPYPLRRPPIFHRCEEIATPSVPEPKTVRSSRARSGCRAPFPAL